MIFLIQKSMLIHHRRSDKTLFDSSMVEEVLGTVCLNTVLLSVSRHDTKFNVDDMFLHSFYMHWMMEILQLNQIFVVTKLISRIINRLFGLITQPFQSKNTSHCFCPSFVLLFADKYELGFVSSNHASLKVNEFIVQMMHHIILTEFKNSIPNKLNIRNVYTHMIPSFPVASARHGQYSITWCWIYT